VRERLAFAAHLSLEAGVRFRQHLQLFIAEKRFEGLGLEITDEIRVVVAGEAARLTMNLDFDLYDAIESVVVRPSAIKRDDARVLGLVHRFGTVVLAWDAVEHGLHNDDDGLNTSVHEFAHAIDLRDGDFDGTPPLHTTKAVKAWASVCARRFLQLRADPARNVLRAYGAENEAEFFAVAVEAFFEKPDALKKKAPDLYAVLADFFQQHPRRLTPQRCTVNVPSAACVVAVPARVALSITKLPEMKRTSLTTSKRSTVTPHVVDVKR
jgi:Mlc titration factor MtfA (ptsG expression regulator)